MTGLHARVAPFASPSDAASSTSAGPAHTVAACTWLYNTSPSFYVKADPAAADLAAFASLQSVFTYHLAPASHSS